jgi:polysaccharide biosynthesis/export protein
MACMEEMRRPIMIYRVLRGKGTCILPLMGLLMGLLFLPLGSIAVQSAGGAEAYRLAPGDRIAINVFGQADLSGDFLVDGAGDVSLPLAGPITIGGLTVLECEQQIAKRLSDGYVRDPSVSVRIHELRPIYVVGDVKSPGSYPYRYSAPVLSAIAMAGGVGVAEQLRGVATAELVMADERVRVLETTRRALLVKRARLEAQRKGARTFEVPDLPSIEAGDDQIASVAASEREALDVQMQTLDQEVELLHQQKPRLQAEIEAVKGQTRAEARQLELIQTRLQEYKSLQGKGLYVSSTGVELEREQARNQGNLSRFASDLARLDLELGNVDIRVREAYNATTRRVMSELQETRTKLQEIDVTLPMARELRDVKRQQAGGTGRADGDGPRLSITIIRSRGQEAHTLSATETTLLEPGDVVEVRKLLRREQSRPAAAEATSNGPKQDDWRAAAPDRNVVAR